MLQRIPSDKILQDNGIKMKHESLEHYRHKMHYATLGWKKPKQPFKFLSLALIFLALSLLALTYVHQVDKPECHDNLRHTISTIYQPPPNSTIWDQETGLRLC